MPKILISGNAGFIGSYIQDELIKQGHEVYGVDNLQGGFRCNINQECKDTLILDLNNKGLHPWIETIKPEILVHVAASAHEGASFYDPVTITKDNFMGYMNMLESCIKAGGLKFVNCFSSMACYGDQESPFKEDMPLKPVDIYAVNKVAMELATRQMSECYGFKYSITVPHNCIGPRQSLNDPFRNVAAIFMNRIMRGETLYIYGDGNQTRQFSSISDALPSMIKMVDEKYHGERINIGGMQVFTVNKLLDLIVREFRDDFKIPEIVHTPDRFGEVKHAYCLPDKSIKLLGYEDYGIANCIKEMAAWAIKLGPQEWRKRKLAIYSDRWPESWKIHNEKL